MSHLGPENRELLLPLDVVVSGVPASHQAKDRQRVRRWMAKVRAAAIDVYPTSEGLLTVPLRLVVVHYHLSAPLIDRDNMIKPIQDALIGVVYADDKHITDVQAASRDLNGPFRVRGMPPRLADAFVAGDEFVHIRVTEPPNAEELLI